ncbi:hypothetical protein EH30_09245 [Erythrobacter sp. JL475]|nr:hypothetical protein EH30_09245 [Erythrobacter sp. JL475]
MCAFDGRKIEVEALHTDSLSEARHRLAECLKRFDRKVAKVLGEVDPSIRSHAPARRKHSPDRDEIDEAVRDWLRTREAEAVQQGLSLPMEQKEREAKVVSIYEEATRMGMRGRQSSALLTSWIADHLQERHRWALDEGHPLRDYLKNRVARAQVEWAKALRAELLFEQRPAPDAIFSPELYRIDDLKRQERQAVPVVPIMELFEAYVAESQPAPATRKAWQSCLNSLIEHLGHEDANRVSRADIVAWKDGLLAPEGGRPPRSQRTVSAKYLAAAKTVFGWGERNLRIKENPAAKVSVSVPSRVQLRDEPGLSDAEANLILGASLNAFPDKRSRLRGYARRWVPWLCAYSGARVGEMTQLRSEDVFRHETGIWCLRITPAAGSEKTKKTRLVPIHPHLIEQGFLDMVRQRKGPLFYDPDEHRGGSEGNPQHKKVAERLAEWVRELGVDDRQVQPNHGWRHRFKRLARDIRMDPEVRDAIQGHAPRTEGQKYGGVSVRIMDEEIRRIPHFVVR